MAGATLAAPAISNAYELADLPYPFEALEPYIDAPTMKIHHDKHHATYVANINKATEGKDEVPILDLMADALEAGPGVRNSGGGHYNHAFFWDLMTSPDAAKKTAVSDQLQKLVDSSFGSMDEMKAKFEAQAAPGAVFGSGWVWVCVNQAGDKLEIVGTSIFLPFSALNYFTTWCYHRYCSNFATIILFRFFQIQVPPTKITLS